MITNVFIVACLAAFFITLARKWGIIESVQVHGNEFFSQMFHCDFCLSFWTAWLVVFVMYAATGDNSLAIVPFLSTPITRRLL